MPVITDDDMHASIPRASAHRHGAETSPVPASSSSIQVAKINAGTGAGAVFDLGACLLASDGWPVNAWEGL